MRISPVILGIDTYTFSLSLHAFWISRAAYNAHMADGVLLGGWGREQELLPSYISFILVLLQKQITTFCWKSKLAAFLLIHCRVNSGGFFLLFPTQTKYYDTLAPASRNRYMEVKLLHAKVSACTILLPDH